MRRREVTEDARVAHDLRLLGVRERHADDLDTEARRVRRVDRRVDAAGQVREGRQAHDGVEEKASKLKTSHEVAIATKGERRARREVLPVNDLTRWSAGFRGAARSAGARVRARANIRRPS